MKKTLSLMIIASAFIFSCKKTNTIKPGNTNGTGTNTGTTAQQAKLVYLGYNNDNNPEIDNLMSVNYDGTGVMKLFTVPNGQSIDNTVMSPDNKTIFLTLFHAINGGETSYGNLYSFNVANGKLTLLLDESGTVTNNTSLEAHAIGTIPATATQQSQLLYGVNSNGSLAYTNFFELHTVNLDGTGDKKIALSLSTNNYFSRAHLFQDKKTLLINIGNFMTSNASDDSYSLASCNIDGTNFKILGQIFRKQYGPGPGTAVAVVGTPSQGSIFYDHDVYDNAGNYLYNEIWVSNTDLSGVKKLNITLPTTDLFIGSSGAISVSPDGKTIFFPVSSHNATSIYTNQGIYSCNIDGSNVHAVIPVDLTGVNDYFPLTAY